MLHSIASYYIISDGTAGSLNGGVSQAGLEIIPHFTSTLPKPCPFYIGLDNKNLENDGFGSQWYKRALLRRPGGTKWNLGVEPSTSSTFVALSQRGFRASAILY